MPPPEADAIPEPQQWVAEALLLHRGGRLAEADSLYLKALEADAEFLPALQLIGLLRIQAGRPAEALPYIERALSQQAGKADLLSHYGIALDAVGRRQEALAVFHEVLQLNPNDPRAWSNRGALLAKLHRHREALADLERALALDPSNGDTWTNRGLILMLLDRPQEAVHSYDRVLERRPGHAEARNNRGLALKALGRAGEALAEFDRVLKDRPAHTGAWVNRASVLRTLGEADLALESYGHALAAQPDMPEALASRASCLWAHKGDVAGAITDLKRLVALRPDYPYARGDLLHMKMHAGDWRELADERLALDAAVRAGQRVVEPYIYQGLSSSPADLLACARIYVEDKYPSLRSRPPPRRAEGNIRLGYLCGEFRAQATMYLAAGLLERHDRARFEVTGFDNSRDDGSAMRKRVIGACDRFLPIQTLSDREAAELIRARQIDILINLNGFFGALRMGVFARRPAPLQVNYLGFPGSLGADYMDYLIADAEVIPAGEEQYYSEKVVRLPGSYQINDGTRPPPAPAGRAEYGLPETDFVFCTFNSSYKITPEMFALWLRLLNTVPSSVLWLLECNALFAANVRREIAATGIDAARLIFAPRLEHSAHVSRLALADLFLDSLPCNAHTTASDALWAGLPVITCRGGAFAGRVAASLLRAVGLPELIADSLDEYESLAHRLATNRALLRCYRHRLEAQRHSLPLFDTARTTLQIESAYEQMLTRWTQGLDPVSFEVTPS